MEKDMKYFMQAKLKEREIVEIPGVKTFKDEKGNIIPFKVQVLNSQEISDIYEKYRKKKHITDKKGVPMVKNGAVVTETETDATRALRRLIVEALVYPNLKDKELMDFYDCPGYDDMPVKLFPDPKDYNYVQNSVLRILGVSDEEEEDDIETAKN